MARLFKENPTLYHPDSIEEKFEQSDAAVVAIKEHERTVRMLFKKTDTSVVNGRPHHLTGWLSGILANIGYRKK